MSQFDINRAKALVLQNTIMDYGDGNFGRVIQEEAARCAKLNVNGDRST